MALAVPPSDCSIAVAIEQNSLHAILIYQPIAISRIRPPPRSRRAAEPAHHILGRQHGASPHGQGGIFRMPAIDSHRCSWSHDSCQEGWENCSGPRARKFVPAMSPPGFGIKESSSRQPRRMSHFKLLNSPQDGWLLDMRNTFRGAFRFLIHGELICVNRLILVDSILNVPAREVAAISSRESAGAKSADGSSLPITIVYMPAVKGRFLGPRISQRQTNGAFPSCFGNSVSGKRPGRGKKNDR